MSGMSLILCLAHHCEKHGPTPLMVTQGLPVSCPSCPGDEVAGLSSSCPERPPGTSTQANTAMTEALRRMDLGRVQRSPSVPASEQEAHSQRAALFRAVSSTSSQPSAIETPPQSPSSPLPNTGVSRSDAGFRKTYDDYATNRAQPCENCALTLPKRQDDAKVGGVDSRFDSGPTLRSRLPSARVYGGPDKEAPTPEGREHEDEHRPNGTATPQPSTISSSLRGSAHTHYLDYTSTHEPVIAKSFTSVRRSCLRTLSMETLPRSPVHSVPAGVPTPPSGSPRVSVSSLSTGNVVSGGPIFFGDPAAGYTTAYIFRIPDMHARGHKRVYAFLALSSHRERVAMKTFGYVASVFGEMASWIQTLVEEEAERVAGESGAGTTTPRHGSASSLMLNDASFSGDGSRSSFLASRRGLSARYYGGGGGGINVKPKQRGLPELVGRPDFFLELHTKFVRLLLELGVALGS